jgi:hypothetical protein
MQIDDEILEQLLQIYFRDIMVTLEEVLFFYVVSKYYAGNYCHLLLDILNIE